MSFQIALMMASVIQRKKRDPEVSHMRTVAFTLDQLAAERSDRCSRDMAAFSAR